MSSDCLCTRSWMSHIGECIFVFLVFLLYHQPVFKIPRLSSTPLQSDKKIFFPSPVSSCIMLIDHSQSSFDRTLLFLEFSIPPATHAFPLA